MGYLIHPAKSYRLAGGPGAAHTGGTLREAMTIADAMAKTWLGNSVSITGDGLKFAARAIAAARRAFDETDWSTNRAFRSQCLRQLHAALEREKEALRPLVVAMTVACATTRSLWPLSPCRPCETSCCRRGKESVSPRDRRD